VLPASNQLLHFNIDLAQLLEQFRLDLLDLGPDARAAAEITRYQGKGP
jgi:hypothetical protein